ncbi:MAG: RHS repeat protein [Chitinophagaceae bacterium]|nr:RHS repeat protein [Chitinophagaceae bacterium]
MIQGICLGQSSNGIALPAILPPSPNAAELGKYGDIPINMSTGALNLSIPLFSYKTKNLEVPLSLSYTTNGFRVNAIGSRSGIDWVLNAGGLITRTIVDDPDLTYPTVRLHAPPLNVLNDTLWNFLDQSTLTYNDVQPDIFYYNFNHYTGKFIVNDSGGILTMPHSNLKFEYTTTASNVSFKVTTPEGIQYFFGGDSATELNRIVASSVCGGIPGFRDDNPTAWNLTKIVHPDGDSIMFLYETGTASYYSNVFQTIYTRDNSVLFCSPASISCPIFSDQLCYPSTHTRYSRIKKISSTAYGTIELTYQNRSDINGDGLVSSIALYDDAHNQLKKFLFEYQSIISAVSIPLSQIQDAQQKNWHFLSKISEYGTTNTDPKIHAFEYDRPSQVPPRLAFCQDYEGFYNGKTNNQYLVPLPGNAADRAAFNNVGGNRDPDSNYASIGLLKKVTYPTGGYNQIVYESHQKPSTQIVTHQNTIRENAAGRGDDNEESVVYNHTFTASYSSSTNISAAFFSDDGSTDPDTHIKMKAAILNAATNAVLYTKTVAQNQNVSGDHINIVAGTSYTMRVTVFGPHLFYGSMYLDYFSPPTYDTVPITVIYPGTRIKQVVATDSSDDMTPKLTRYYYRRLPDFAASNVQSVTAPIFIVPLSTIVQCLVTNAVINTQGCSYRALYSNPQNPEALVPFSTMYTSVLQSNGDYFENGGKELKFDILDHNGSFPVFGHDQIQAPHSNLGYENGALLEENTFRWINKTPVYLQKKVNTYTVDSRNSSSVKGYFINRTYDPVASTIPHQAAEFQAFDVNYYILGTPWQYISQTTTTNFDQNGLNPSVQTFYYSYNNAQHALITSSRTIDSKGRELVDSLVYPQDITLTGMEETARQRLISVNNVGAVIEKKTRHNQQSFLVHNSYKLTPELHAVQDKVRTNTGPAHTMETSLTYTDYDVNANIQGYVPRDGVPKCYLYGYKSQYPVAEITGATYTDVKSHVTQSILDNPASDAQLRSHLDGLRTAFPGAIIKTYTYLPLVGMTSETDNQGRTTYYEYDNFSRLSVVRDKDGNIIKRIRYHYRGQSGN